jgi:hypothetical protein
MTGKPDTKRIAQVRRMVEAGRSNDEIADKLGITYKAVRGIISRNALRPIASKVCKMPNCGAEFSNRTASLLCTTCTVNANDKIRELHALGHSAPSMAPLIGLPRANIENRMKTMHLRSHGRNADPSVPTIEPVVRTRKDNFFISGFTLPGVVARPAPLPIPPARECQWIFGEPSAVETHFCGKPAVAKSYCAGHFATCYVPKRPQAADVA